MSEASGAAAPPSARGGRGSAPAAAPSPAGGALRAAGRVLAARSTSLAPRVVVLGGGFGGVAAALGLARRCAGLLPVRVTLVSDRNYFLFTPMLAEAATGAVETRHVLHPLRPLCTAAGIEFAEMTVEGVDLGRRRVRVRHQRSPVRQELHYDRLVLALGAAPNTAIAPGAAEHALTFKAAGDAIQIRNRVIDLFEAAALTDDPWVRRRLLTIVVVGAGHAGTELVAALEELTRGILLRHYPTIPPDAVRLVLVGSGVLPQTAPHLAAWAKEQLERRGIVLEAARAARLTPDGLALADGRFIDSGCVIWTAGNRVSPVVAGLDVPKARDGRILVNEFFEVAGWPGVYALGDNAAQSDVHSGQPYVATAQVAIRQGARLAEQLEAELTGRSRRPFRFRLLGEMVPLSRRTAVADLMGWKLVGFPAWFLWKTVYMLKLPTLATRVRVVLDWTVELFFERDVSELTVDERQGG
jgi:NADH dehydrogenase